MTCRVDRIPLPGDAPGENRCLTVRRYGTPGARPKVYLQGGLHADELPGPLALHHLSRLLDKADAAGEVLGEIVLVPAANPIGSGQIIQHRHLGRFALSDGGNFNRGFADLAAPAIDRLDLEVLRDEATLAADFRQAMAEVLDGLHPLATVDRLRHTLLGLAFDADIALDLHCDDRSLHHLFVGDDLWPELADLAGLLGIEVVLTSTNSEGLPFEEALSMPWWWLRSRLAERAGEATAPSPLAPLPLGCLSATVELGGQADVDDETAASDAEGLIRFMRHRGALAGDAGELPASGEAYPLEADGGAEGACRRHRHLSGPARRPRRPGRLGGGDRRRHCGGSKSGPSSGLCGN